MAYRSRTFIDRINDIDIEDLQYLERDLCFYELVSVGFLLYGRERTTSEFILQKLIVLQQNPPKGKGEVQVGASDILRKYATINTSTWRLSIVEALAIIRAKKVLRKLGFLWQELHDMFLPHIPEISIHIHPLLKALYKICERLSIAQTGRLVMTINEMHLRQESQAFRFYDHGYLEVFLLYWMTRGIIAIGDQKLHGSNVQELISYFKLNDLDSMKSVLMETINHNSVYENLNNAAPAVSTAPANAAPSVRQESDTNKDSGAVMDSVEMLSAEQVPQTNGRLASQDHEEFDYRERYIIKRKGAGYVLIINQSEFYADPNPELKRLLPRIPFKKHRTGTDVDRDNLKQLFCSFGYTPLVYNNLSNVDMLRFIRETVQKSWMRDSLIVCILSHGMEGVVYGCNSVPVSINNIKAILADDPLKGKPKMLIIQACQKNIAPVDTSVSNGESIVQPDAYADMLIAMSSIAGTDAIRHTLTGSWFIDSLCKLTKKWYTRKHMSDILTNVMNDVSKKNEENEFMMPIISSTLRKDFYLPSHT